MTDDESVALDYPIVYVRVPRPYPKEYFHINHLNQAGLHQTNAPGAELRLRHPVALKDGRVTFSSLEIQGLRGNEQWGIWAIHPDGTSWNPLTSALDRVLKLPR